MKRKLIITTLAGIFALSGLLAMHDPVQLDDRELGIGEYGEQAHSVTPEVNDRELGIGEYGEQAHVIHETPNLDDRELGIGNFSENG